MPLAQRWRASVADRFVELYADLTIRGGDAFDRQLTDSKQNLELLGRSADESSEQVRQAAIRQTSAYERVRSEVDKTATAARNASQKYTDAVGREKLATDRLQDAIKKHGSMSTEAIRAQSRLTDAHKDTERALKRSETAADQLIVKQRQQVNAAQKAAQEIRRANEQMGEGVSSGAGMDGITSKLGALGEKGSEVGASFGGNFMAGFAPRIASLGSKGGPIGAAIAGVAVVGLAAGALLAKSIQDGAARQQDQNLVQAQLGLSPERAGELGKAASEAYMANFGESVAGNMDAIRAAMQSGLISRDASQGEMEAVAGQLATVSKIMGTDVPETARAAGQAIKTGMVRDGAQAMDLLVAATQRGLNINDDLLDTLNEYGTQFRKVGLDGQTALGLVSQAMQAGARDSDVAADAIKEFSVRVIDGSKSTTGALQTLGLDGIDEQIAQGGEKAKAGLDSILDKLREMPPGVEKSQIAFALFGTQWEDLGGAFEKFDLSTAADELGRVGGAAQRAADDMANGPGAAMEQTRRVIEESTMEVKQTLAEAFGPLAQDIAAGLVENKDEIAAFFADVISAALQFGIAFGNVAAGALHIWGFTTGKVGEMVGTMVEQIGRAMSAIGGIVEKIPGMRSIGNAMQSTGDAAVQVGDGLQQMGDASHGAANYIADTLVPALANAKDKVDETGDASRNAAARMDLLRDSVIGVPDGKSVIISDNSPATISRLTDLGFVVTTLPNGQVRVEARTEEARAAIAKITETQTKRVIVEVSEQIRRNGSGVPYKQDWIDRARATPRADGGIDGPLPSHATIARPQGRGLIQWAEDETGGEAYIPLGQSKRPRSTAILNEVAGRFGYRLHQAMADGGVREPYGLPIGSSAGAQFPEWVHAIEQAYGVKASTYAGHQEKDGLNKGIDWSGPVDAMQRLAEYFASIRQDLEQVIWMNPNTGQQIGVADGQMVGPGTSQPGYYGNDWAGHTDHVHTRQSFALPANGAAGGGGEPAVATVPLIQNPDGTWTSPDPAWAALIKRESGGNMKIVQQIQDVNTGGNEASGGFQIAKGTWANYGGKEFAPTAGEATPQQQAIVAARIFNAEGGSPWGAGLPGRENEDALRAGLTMTGGTVNVYGADDGTDDDGTSASKPKEPPPDPNNFEFTLKNPLQPFWWKGEKEYRDRIIADEDAKREWDDYINKRGDYAPKKEKSKTKKAKVKSIPDAEEAVANAKEDLTIARQRQSEMKPDAKDSAKMSAQRSIDRAEEKLRKAEEALKEAKANPSGYKVVPKDPTGTGADVKKYAQGDVRNGHQPEMVRPGDYRVWGEPESGGESYIPHAPDRRGRALRLWAETGRILGVKGYASGGFGGYSADTRDAMAPKNLYDMLSLGVGAGMTAYNAVAPYVMSAVTGQWDLGNLTPKIDTAANSADELPKVVGQFSSQITQQMNELIWAVKEGKNIRIKMEGFGDGSAAGLRFTRQGR